MPSPHGKRAGPEEALFRLVFGEIVRLVDRPIVVREDATVRLPRAGAWETGLARLRPAFDDVLGGTALALAYRWSCAQWGRNAWPSWELIACRATDQPVRGEPMARLARFEGGGAILEGRGEMTWALEGGAGLGTVGIAFDRAPIDRVADIAAAWLGLPWRP